jgi:hypothetical protein
VKLVNGTAKTWLHRDYLGSVRAITDAAGAKIESAVYKPFGPSSPNGSSLATRHRRPKAGSANGSMPTRGSNT